MQLNLVHEWIGLVCEYDLKVYYTAAKPQSHQESL